MHADTDAYRSLYDLTKKFGAIETLFADLNNQVRELYWEWASHRRT